jgi:SSS family transporter
LLFPVRFAALVLLQFAALNALHAEPLVAIATGSLAPLAQDASHLRLLNIEGRLVAFAADSTWILSEDRTSWVRSDWRAPGQIVRAVGDGSRGFVLVGSMAEGPVESIEQLSLIKGELAARALPSLPAALTSAQGAVLGDSLFVAGTLPDGSLELLEFSLATRESVWVKRALRSSSASDDGVLTSMVGQGSALYLTFNSASKSNGNRDERLLRWKPDAGWKEQQPMPGSPIDGTARSIGQAHALYLLRATPTHATAQLASFHTITGSWAVLGEFEAATATAATAWENGVVWAKPAQGGAEFAFAQIAPNKPLLRWLDWVVIVVYLVSMLGIGLYFYLRQKRNSTSDFFVGGRTIPAWAVGVSLYAANTSSISYIAIPAKSFETNWQYLTNNLVAVLGLMFVAVWIVPLLRRLNLMSVFQYLETRFHPVIRTLASGLFIAVQIGSRMSVILFLPSLAIATVTGIDVVWSIAIMGTFTIGYTALGGMKAVVWTDVAQLVVKMGGIVFAITFIVYMLNGGVGELFAVAAAENKMKLFDFSFDLTKATVWGFVFLTLFDVVLTFPKDQVLMQRVLSTRSDKDAGRSIWMFAAITIPGGFMFYMVGTALYAFYKTHPDRLNPLLSIDATFPLFIAAELPMGIRGLIIAGILAAAMATLSSIMNSVATLASVDFYEKWKKNPDPKVSVRFAEIMTVVAGLAGMAVAFVLSRYDIHSLFDISIELASLLGGGFAGAYTLGMFTRRANWQGVAIGVAVSIAVTTTAWSMNLVHPYFYLAISIMVCIAVGYLASWLFPAPTPQSLIGLTIHETAYSLPRSPGEG